MTPRGQAHSSERTRWSLSRLVSRYNQVQHLCGEHLHREHFFKGFLCKEH